MIDWTNEQRDDIITQAMDICANIENFRQIVIVTVANDGHVGSIVQKRENASLVELLGIYRIMTASTEQDILRSFVDDDRPHSEGTDDEDL